MPQFTNSDYQALHALLLSNEAPEFLDLSNKGITDIWARLILNDLRYNQSVKRIDLSNNYITNSGAFFINSSLSETTAPAETDIIAINLDNNYIDDPILLNSIRAAISKNQDLISATTSTHNAIPTTPYTPTSISSTFYNTSPSGGTLIDENSSALMLYLGAGGVVMLFIAIVITGTKVYAHYKKPTIEYRPDPHLATMVQNPAFQNVELRRYGDYHQTEIADSIVMSTTNDTELYIEYCDTEHLLPTQLSTQAPCRRFLLANSQYDPDLLAQKTEADANTCKQMLSK